MRGPIRRLKDIARKLGFTELEIKVILFLAGVFLAGLIINFTTIKDEKSELLQYNSDKVDSLYYSSTISGKNIEKRVDSKQELLDFSVDKSSVSSEDNYVLLERSINLNTADIKQFINLPGIGIKTAEEIVLFRNRIGGFSSVDQMLEVKGIGEAKLNSIKKYVFVDKN